MLLIALILIAGLILFFALQVLYFLTIIAIAVAVFFIILVVYKKKKRKHKNNRMNNFEIKKDDFEDSNTEPKPHWKTKITGTMTSIIRARVVQNIKSSSKAEALWHITR